MWKRNDMFWWVLMIFLRPWGCAHMRWRMQCGMDEGAFSVPCWHIHVGRLHFHFCDYIGIFDPCVNRGSLYGGVTSYRIKVHGSSEQWNICLITSELRCYMQSAWQKQPSVSSLLLLEADSRQQWFAVTVWKTGFCTGRLGLKREIEIDVAYIVQLLDCCIWAIKPMIHDFIGMFACAKRSSQILIL